MKNESERPIRKTKKNRETVGRREREREREREQEIVLKERDGGGYGCLEIASLSSTQRREGVTQRKESDRENAYYGESSEEGSTREKRRDKEMINKYA